jgi:hypothetical protein
MRRACGLHIARAAAAALLASAAAAQDLEPRAYAVSPLGTTFLVIGAGRSTGSVVVDPTLPIADIDAGINAATIGVARTFAIGDRLALASAALPYSWGDINGRVGEDARSIRRSGLADLRAKLSVNLWGARALAPAEFAKAKPTTIVGVSLTAAAPTGQYDPAKLINLGTNRWAFKPEIGVSHPVGRWHVDGYGGIWFFTGNDSFFPGTSRRQQHPVTAFQGHVSYALTRRAWAAFDATWYGGGRVTVDGGEPSDRQSNMRLGATLAAPLGRRQSIKVFFSGGATTRTGTDFRTLGVAWQVFWVDRPPRPSR